MQYLNKNNQTCIVANADQTGLPNESATIVYGEAMLTMLSERQKINTIQEANRILKTNGRYGIHELCLVPDDLPEEVKSAIQKDLSVAIRINARPLTKIEWKNLLEQNGFQVKAESTAPMHLLKFQRMLEDEGVGRTFKIAINCITRPNALKRVLEMYKVFQKYEKHLGSISLVAEKK